MTRQRTTRQRTVLPPAQRARMTTKSSRQQQGVEAPRSAPVVVRIEEGELIWELRMRQEEETLRRKKKEETRKTKEVVETAPHRVLDSMGAVRAHTGVLVRLVGVSTGEGGGSCRCFKPVTLNLYRLLKSGPQTIPRASRSLRRPASPYALDKHGIPCVAVCLRSTWHPCVTPCSPRCAT